MKSLLVALSVYQNDIDLVKMNLDICIHFEEKYDFKALVCYSGIGSSDVKEVTDKCDKVFSSVDKLDLGLRESELHDINIRRNRLWQNTARHIESNEKCNSWFWWEPDLVPVRKGWLEDLWKQHSKNRNLFGGYFCLDSYMHGSAFWPKEITPSTQSTAALYVTNYPYDKVAGSTTRRSLNKMNGHFLSFKKAYGDGINLGYDTGSVEKWLINNPETCVFIDAFDSEIRDVLVGKKPKSRKSDDGLLVPSFTEQTPWESGLFTFPNVTDTCFFNPSIGELNGKKYLFPRRWRFNRDDPYTTKHGYGSDLVVWPIRSNMTLGIPPSVPELPMRYKDEQWEDPRVTEYNGDFYISFANWVYNTPWAIRQSFTRLSKSFDKVDVVFEPDFGGNSSSHSTGKFHEKNWVWFNRGNQWHCVYSPDPQVVFKVNRHGEVINTWENENIKLNWNYGLPLRGSTCPLLFNNGEEYLCFFHSAKAWRGPKRRYVMGAYTFDSKPPFGIKRMTHEPILCGSDSDFRSMNSPLVIFPSGAIFEGDKVLVVFGVNDEHCGWIKIPIDELNQLLTVLA